MNEIWKKHPYLSIEVSSLGKVRSIDKVIEYISQGQNRTRKTKGKLLKQQVDLDGYLKISYLGKFIHKLVAETFLINYENKPVVNHIDGNKKNNNVNNLEWVTRSENDIHAFKIGLRSNKGKKNPAFGKYNIKNNYSKPTKDTGESNNNSKITEKDVIWIRKNIGNYTQKEMGEKFNINQSMVSSIIRRESWKHI